MTESRMGTLDHVHVRVPDRAEAARWYSEHLGFEPVAEYDFWATGIDFGPLQISADGGRSMLALFEFEDYDASSRQHAGIAFSVDAATFGEFARSLSDGAIPGERGGTLAIGDVVDFDLCFAYNFADPWGNVYELNCYDTEAVLRDLVDAEGLSPIRYWPAPEGGPRRR